MKNKYTLKDNPEAVNALQDSFTNHTGQTDIDVLVRLLPFYDIDLSQRNKEDLKAKQLRQMLCISRSEADNLFKSTGICTLHDLVNTYFDELL